MNKLDLSPSLTHQLCVKQTTQKLAFDPSQDVVAWQKKLRGKLKSLLGKMPVQRVPLQSRTLWKRDTKLGSIEKISFVSEPCADVLAYVCLPRDITPPYTFVICLQGHSPACTIPLPWNWMTNPNPRSSKVIVILRSNA